MCSQGAYPSIGCIQAARSTAITFTLHQQLAALSGALQYLEHSPTILLRVNIDRQQLPREVYRRTADGDDEIKRALGIQYTCKCKTCDENACGERKEAADVVAKEYRSRFYACLDIIMPVWTRIDCIIVNCPAKLYIVRLMKRVLGRGWERTRYRQRRGRPEYASRQIPY